jgi:hypothetical protein
MVSEGLEMVGNSSVHIAWKSKFISLVNIYTVLRANNHSTENKNNKLKQINKNHNTHTQNEICK